MSTATQSTPVRVGVIGTGKMGRHHVRILSELPEAMTRKSVRDDILRTSRMRTLKAFLSRT